MHPRNSSIPTSVPQRVVLGLGLGISLFLSAALLIAQSGTPQTTQAPQGPRPRRDASGDYRLSVDVDLVVLHTTVVDRQGHIVSDLRQQNFRVYENNVPQEIAVFRQEDIPLTVGLVIDNSGSMQPFKDHLKTAALAFVETSNPLDEVFVVNFTDDYFLDLPPGRDFSSDINELKEALEKIRTGGGTALWDTLRASFDHAKRGTRQKRVLLTITDGVDYYSRVKYDGLLRYAQENETAVYIVALPGDVTGRERKKANRQLRKLAEVTGGEVYFPASMEEVDPLCRKIAHDIRNQYVIAYYPSNRARDGSFRSVRVELRPSKGRGQLIARTRTGYYAPAPDSPGSTNP